MKGVIRALCKVIMGIAGVAFILAPVSSFNGLLAG
jgi:hypothetical protein